MATQTDYSTSENRPGSRLGDRHSRRVVDQEMNDEPAAESQEQPDVTGNLGNLGADLISLGELQLELLSVDVRDAAQNSFSPALFASLGLGLVIGCCPLVLLGLSWWLADLTELSVAGASLIVAAVGLVMAAILFYLAWRGLRESLNLLNRSRIELSSNLRWIKKILSDKHRKRGWGY